VHAEGLRYLDGDDHVIGHESDAYVLGSVGVSSFSTNTCLASGESGYIVDAFVDVDFGKVSAVDFVLTASEASDWTAPASTVATGTFRPQGNGLAIDVENRGPKPVQLGSIIAGELILFDEQNLPLGLGLLDPCDASASRDLPAGQSLPLCNTYFSYSGHATVAQTWIDFEDASAGKRLSPEQQAVRDARMRLVKRMKAAR
jgi:hypothetical protein